MLWIITSHLTPCLPDKPIEAPDAASATLAALAAMGLTVIPYGDVSLRRVEVTIMPDGRMSEEDAAKYLGLSVHRLRRIRQHSKRYRHQKVGRKAPRSFKRTGLIWYFKDDLDAWIYGGGSDLVAEKRAKRRRHYNPSLTSIGTTDNIAPVAKEESANPKTEE